MSETRKNKLFAYTFLVGIILAVVVGISTRYTRPNTIYYILLIALGIAIGYLSNYDKESASIFLLASASLVVVGGLGNSTLVFIGNISHILSTLNAIVRMILVLFIPATIIAALKLVFSMAKI